MFGILDLIFGPDPPKPSKPTVEIRYIESRKPRFTLWDLGLALVLSSVVVSFFILGMLLKLAE